MHESFHNYKNREGQNATVFGYMKDYLSHNAKAKENREILKNNGDASRLLDHIPSDFWTQGEPIGPECLQLIDVAKKDFSNAGIDIDAYKTPEMYFEKLKEDKEQGKTKNDFQQANLAKFELQVMQRIYSVYSTLFNGDVLRPEIATLFEGVDENNVKKLLLETLLVNYSQYLSECKTELELDGDQQKLTAYLMTIFQPLSDLMKDSQKTEKLLKIASDTNKQKLIELNHKLEKGIKEISKQIADLPKDINPNALSKAKKELESIYVINQNMLDKNEPIPIEYFANIKQTLKTIVKENFASNHIFVPLINFFSQLFGFEEINKMASVNREGDKLLKDIKKFSVDDEESAPAAPGPRRH